MYQHKLCLTIYIYIYTYIYIYIHTYEHVNGSASIQSALDILNDSDKQHVLNNVEQWNCGMDDQMFDLVKYSSIYCKNGL